EGARLHGNARGGLVLARRRIDLVFDLEFGHRWGLGGRGGIWPLDLSAALALVPATATTPASAPTSGGSIVLRSLRGRGAALLLGFGLEKRLTIGDRNLIIIRMNFSKGQEAVPVPAVIDESGLQRRFYARDLGEVNIPAKLLLAR